MSMQDPIADLLTHIRNGLSAKKQVVRLAFSNIKESIVKVLVDEGYLLGWKVNNVTPAIKELEIDLKYFNGRPVISEIHRASSPGLRNYKSKKNLPKVQGGLGIAIISTSRGVMSDKKAKEIGHGGEVLCIVK